MKAVLFVVVGIVLMFILSGALGLATSYMRERRLGRLATSRDPNKSFALFRAAFTGLPESFIGDSYALIQDLVAVKKFPVEPSDNIWKMLELDQGDVENRLETIFEKYPKSMEMLREATGPIETVRELVAFIYNLAQQGAPADILSAAARHQGSG